MAGTPYLTPFRAVIMDRSRNVVKLLNNVIDPQWSHVLPGGCDTAQFTILDNVENIWAYIKRLYRVDLYWNGVKVWAGFIDSPEFIMTDAEERCDVKCVGYSNALGLRLINSQVSVSTDAGTLMSSIVSPYFGTGAPSPLADITLGTVVTAGYTVGSYVAQQKYLSDVVNELSVMGQDGNGNPYEWLIDETRTFTYRVPATTASHWAVVGRDLLELHLVQPGLTIRNNLFINGTLANGVPATGTVLDTTSINTYGQMDGVVRFGVYGQAADLQQAAAVGLKRDSAALDQLKVVLWRPNDQPEPLTNLKIGDVLQVRGFSDGSTFTYKLVQTRFHLTDSGLTLEADLNAITPGVGDFFARKLRTATDLAVTQNTKMQYTGASPGVFPLQMSRSTFADSNSIPT